MHKPSYDLVLGIPKVTSSTFKQIIKASPDSRAGELDSTSQLENVRESVATFNLLYKEKN